MPMKKIFLYEVHIFDFLHNFFIVHGTKYIFLIKIN
jgi:hypothetical protein